MPELLLAAAATSPTMSLLRSVLKKKSTPAVGGDGTVTPVPFNPGKASSSKKGSSAQSFKSVASTIKSISSFYSVLTGGGPKIPKRRRPPILTFGAPKFYYSDPPPPDLVDGVERMPIEQTTGQPFTAAHATSLLDDNKEAWLSIVVFNHARPIDAQAMYHDTASVTGEVRLVLTKSRNIESIDVWVRTLLDFLPGVFATRYRIDPLIFVVFAKARRKDGMRPRDARQTSRSAESSSVGRIELIKEALCSRHACVRESSIFQPI